MACNSSDLILNLNGKWDRVGYLFTLSMMLSLVLYADRMPWFPVNCNLECTPNIYPNLF